MIFPIYLQKYSGKRDDAHDTDDRQGVAHRHMAEGCANDPERDDRHDDEGLAVAAKRNGQERVDREEGERVVPPQAGEALVS